MPHSDAAAEDKRFDRCRDRVDVPGQRSHEGHHDLVDLGADPQARAKVCVRPLQIHNDERLLVAVYPLLALADRDGEAARRRDGAARAEHDTESRLPGQRLAAFEVIVRQIVAEVNRRVEKPALAALDLAAPPGIVVAAARVPQLQLGVLVPVPSLQRGAGEAPALGRGVVPQVLLAAPATIFHGRVAVQLGERFGREAGAAV